MQKLGTFDTILFIYEKVQSPVFLNTGGVKQARDCFTAHRTKPLSTSMLPKLSSAGSLYRACSQARLELLAPSVSVVLFLCSLSLLLLPQPHSPLHPYPKQYSAKPSTHIILVPWQTCILNTRGYIHKEILVPRCHFRFLSQKFRSSKPLLSCPLIL